MIVTDERRLYLRPVELFDARLLFQWRNEKETRANSLHSEELVYEDHVRWLENVLGTTKAQYFFILMADLVPVGQIRLAVENKMALISYSIDAAHRGRGYGRTILQMAEENLRDQHVCLTLVGYVKEENVASQRAFASLHYHESRENDLLRYEKVIGEADNR